MSMYMRTHYLLELYGCRGLGPLYLRLVCNLCATLGLRDLMCVGVVTCMCICSVQPSTRIDIYKEQLFAHMHICVDQLNTVLKHVYVCATCT
jgi:hypothetical protein